MAELVKTFETTYSSSELSFGQPRQPDHLPTRPQQPLLYEASHIVHDSGEGFHSDIVGEADRTLIQPSLPRSTKAVSTHAHKFKKRAVFASLAFLALLFIAGLAWFANRYDDRPQQAIALVAFARDEYPENPENTSSDFGAYPHRQLIIQRLGDTHFRFLLEPATPQAAAIELSDVDLAHFVAAVPPWAKSDPDLTKIGLIDREWNRQQVRFARTSTHLDVREGGDGFEQRALTRVDLARNCLNAGLWELLLFTTENGEERVYEHLWFTFPLGLYKQVFEQVNGLSYWSYWWSLEHWVDPSGTPIRLDRFRTVEQEWPVQTMVRWDEPVAMKGAQVRKRKNILTPVAATYRDWYNQPVRFASFIPPGRYSRAHPRETQLHYLAELTGAMVRQVKLIGGSQPLFEIELAFRSPKTGEITRLILGGLDGAAIPVASPDHYDRGWQVPLGIGNPSFFEAYGTVVENPPTQRVFYGFHLDAKSRWLDHHAIGVDGPLFHWDADDPSRLHLYLLSYERHTLLNHVILTIPHRS
ncbi:MAG: hypothetical protein ABIQ79_08520 [Nitrospiraceae bacterium]